MKPLIPVVDRLVVTVAVDNTYDNFARAGAVGGVAVRRTPVPYPVGSAPSLLSEHGLAYHLESALGEERREILLDFSLTGPTLVHNYEVLGIDPARADALVLSHGHDDHYGGLPFLARRAEGRTRAGLALHAGGDDVFGHRWDVKPDGRRVDRGRLDRVDLESRGIAVRVLREPTVVAGHAATSGPIPRLTGYEMSPPSARLEAEAGGSAAPGDLVPDLFRGEHATAYHVKGRGLVVISSCGHAGIINSIRQVQKVSGVEKVHAVVGGWHLAPYPDEIVEKTVAAAREIDPDVVVPMHCTGWRAIMALQRAMPEKVIMPSTGTRIVFGE